jgi:hypothetical protein
VHRGRIFVARAGLPRSSPRGIAAVSLAVFVFIRTASGKGAARHQKKEQPASRRPLLLSAQLPYLQTTNLLDLLRHTRLHFFSSRPILHRIPPCIPFQHTFTYSSLPTQHNILCQLQAQIISPSRRT